MVLHKNKEKNPKQTQKTYKPFTLNIFQQILWCWMENEFNRILLFCCNICGVQQYYSWC